jgi:DNA primase
MKITPKEVQNGDLFRRVKEKVDLRAYAVSIGADFDGNRSFCPLHKQNSNSPSFDINEEKDVFYCHGCNAGGDVISLAQAHHGLDLPWQAAMKLAEEYNIEAPQIDPKVRQLLERRRAHFERVAHHAQQMFEQTQPEYAEWWAGRSFTPEMQEQFLLSGQKLYEGRYATFPLTANKQMYCFVGRNIDDDPNAPKYIAPKEENLPPGMTQQPLFVPAPIRKGGFYLVEGYIDALALAASGHQAVAIGGTNPGELREAQLLELCDKAGPAYIIPDKDETGVKTAREWAKLLYPNALILPTITPDPKDGIKDPADYFKKHGAEALSERLKELEGQDKDHIELSCEELRGMRPRNKASYLEEEVLPVLARQDINDLNVEIAKKELRKAAGLTAGEMNHAVDQAFFRRLLADRDDASVGAEGGPRSPSPPLWLPSAACWIATLRLWRPLTG